MPIIPGVVASSKTGHLQPLAPTIGTATDGGTGSTVSVSFTPAATGPAATSFTATSTPGGFTATGASSPLTVSGLTAGTSYTFTVHATNAAGNSPESAASNSVTPVVPSSFYNIATQTITSGTNSITFSSIPSTYKSLQIRSSALSNSSSLFLTINGDNGNNYAWHRLLGTAGSAGALGFTNQPSITINGGGGSWSGSSGNSYNAYGVSIIDIIDYASTSKNKTVRAFAGVDDNTTTSYISVVGLESGLWLNTSAITSITISLSTQASSTFALYGVN